MDRELLELAAKAAGIEYEGCDHRRGLLLFWDHPSQQSSWNPLTDDGDALRLAAKLRIVVQHEPRYVVAIHVSKSRLSEVACHEDNGIDPYAATRRAIVRAAAEIGRGL